MLNIAANLQRTACYFPDKIAIHFMDQTITYGQLNAAVNQIANGLRSKGVGKGDKVVLACPNLPYFPMIYYAILKLGAVVVPINILLKGSEIAYHLKDSDAKAFFCFEGGPELPLGSEGLKGFKEAGTCTHFFVITADPTKPSAIDDAATLGSLMAGQSPLSDYELTAETDTAVILYTSGTTGKPKGAELSQSNIAMNMTVANQLAKIDSTDVQLITLPLFHSFGQVLQMNSTIQVGASMVLLARFDPDAAFKAMLEHNVTLFAGVPTMFIALLNLPGAAEKYDLAMIATHLRLGISGGAAMPVEVMKKFEAKFGIIILEGYGLSETSPSATFTDPNGERIAGSVGKASLGCEVRLVDESGAEVANGERGEITIRGHNVMKGYYNRPEATAEAIRNGWFYTGDIGKLDADGNIYIVDRVKDMIIRGGFNVYPRELEEVLSAHPTVAQVAVIGIPHAVHGEEIKAVLILKSGEMTTPEAIITWCKERIAGYKYPRIVEIVDALPMTATGKILKRELRAQHDAANARKS